MDRADLRYRRRPLWPAILAAGLVGLSLAAIFGGTQPRQPSITTAVAPDLAAPDTTSGADRRESAPPAWIGEFPSKPPGWVQLDPGPLVSRMESAAAWTGDAVIIWGGRSLLREYASGGMYASDPSDGPAWSIMAPAPIEGGAVAASAWADDAMFVHTTSAAWYLPATDQWVALDDVVPQDADPIAAAWTGDAVVVVTSPTKTAPTGQTVAVGAPPAPACCRPLAPPPIGVDSGTLLWTGDVLLLVAERSDSGADASVPHFAEYRRLSDTWSELEPPPLSGGHGLATAWTGDSLIVADATLRAAEWSTAGGWRRLPNLPFADRSCHPRMITLDESVFVWYCREAAWLDRTVDTWIDIPTPDLPAHAVSTACVLLAADRQVMLWCGNGDGGQPLFYGAGPAGVTSGAAARIER